MVQYGCRLPRKVEQSSLCSTVAVQKCAFLSGCPGMLLLLQACDRTWKFLLVASLWSRRDLQEGGGLGEGEKVGSRDGMGMGT